jgi:hypothetical protein
MRTRRSDFTFNRLHRSEQSGTSVVGGPVRRLRGLNTHDRGVVSVLFILLFFTFFAATAMVYNTGQTISIRQRPAHVADTVAYMSTNWMSRGMNLIGMTNRIAARNMSAFAVPFANFYVAGMVWKSWTDFVNDTCSPACDGIQAVVACAPCQAAVWAYLAATEIVPHYVPFILAQIGTPLTTMIEGFGGGGVIGRVKDISDFQKSVKNAIPQIIEDQRSRAAQYYNMTIRLTQAEAPDTKPQQADGRVYLPVKEQGFFDTLYPVLARLHQADAGWYNDSDVRGMSIGEAQKHWKNGAYGAAAFAAMWGYLMGGPLNVLPTQTFIFETNVSPDNMGQFSVIASVMDAVNPRQTFFLDGLFPYTTNHAKVITAYAQAETVNPMEGVPLLGFVPVPWRLWSSAGNIWVPRLNKGDKFQAAFNRDSTMRQQFYLPHGVTQSDASRLPAITLH